MTDDTKKNGSGIGRGTGSIRDDKGRFLPGNPGGPGGGKKDDLEGLDFWEATEALIRNAMGTGKTDDKLKAAKLYFQWQGLKKQHDQEQDSLPSAQDVERIRETLALRQEMDVMGVKKIADVYCCECGKRLSPDDAVENDD
jgi:hypothetical protein